MRIKIHSLLQENARVKLNKTPNSVVNLGPQLGAIGEDEKSIFMCLNPNGNSNELYQVVSFGYENGEAIVATGDSFVRLYVREDGSNAFTHQDLDLERTAPHIGGIKSAAVSSSGQLLAIYGATNETNKFPIQFYLMSGGMYESVNLGSRLINDCSSILQVALSGDEFVAYVIYMDMDNVRRHCFFINEDAEYNQRPSGLSDRNECFLNLDGGLLLTGAYRALPKPDIFDVNRATGTLSASPYEITDNTGITQPQLIGRAVFANDSKTALISRYNSIEKMDINSVNATVKVSSMLNATMKDEIGNYPTETKLTVNQAVPGPAGKVLAVITDNTWKSTLCCFNVNAQTGLLEGSFADAITRGYNATDYFGQPDGFTLGPYTGEVYTSYGTGIVALKIDLATNTVTEVTRS